VHGSINVHVLIKGGNPNEKSIIFGVELPAGPVWPVGPVLPVGPV
jgi:hypothetical protein